MEMLFQLVTWFGCSAVWMLPTALAAAAIVDVVRVQAEWYWCFVIFGLPVLGPIAYFAVSYLPIFGGSRAISSFSPTAYRRSQARRRLREIQIQLQHWRGPALLAEAGSQNLALGKLQQAEDLLREAKHEGADVKDVNFDFAQVLQVRGRRWSEALPLLRELVDLEPDARFGAARLALARCLDETGDAQRAEEELRAVLKKRNPPEGKVRLARILIARGEGREASELLGEVRADGAALPRYLYKEHKAWIRAAGKLKAASTKLPPPKLEGVPPRRSPAVLVAIGIGLLLALAILVAGVGTVVLPILTSMSSVNDYGDLWRRSEQVRERLQAADRAHAATVDAADVETVRTALPGFLAVRSAMAEPCAELAAAKTAYADANRLTVESNSMVAAMGSIHHELAWQSAQVELTERFADALESADQGREQFRRLAALVDGAQLQRTGAQVLLLPEHFRSDYQMARQSADQPLPPRSEPGWRKNVETQIEQAKAKLESFRELADVTLPEDTLQLLEDRREELESSMQAGCLDELLESLDPTLAAAYEDY